MGSPNEHGAMSGGSPVYASVQSTPMDTTQEPSAAHNPPTSLERRLRAFIRGGSGGRSSSPREENTQARDIPAGGWRSTMRGWLQSSPQSQSQSPPAVLAEHVVSAPPREVFSPQEILFTKSLCAEIDKLYHHTRRGCIEPVSAPVFQYQLKSALALVALYKNWVFAPGFQLAEHVPQAAHEFAFAARCNMQAAEEGGSRKWFNAVINFANALVIEPRHPQALDGLLRCAEKIAGLSLQRYQSVPVELREAQWQLEQRQQMVDAIVNAELENSPPPRSL